MEIFCTQYNTGIPSLHGGNSDHLKTSETQSARYWLCFTVWGQVPSDALDVEYLQRDSAHRKSRLNDLSKNLMARNDIIVLHGRTFISYGCHLSCVRLPLPFCLSSSILLFFSSLYLLLLSLLYCPYSMQRDKYYSENGLNEKCATFVKQTHTEKQKHEKQQINLLYSFQQGGGCRTFDPQ